MTATPIRERPRPLASLTAAARRLTSAGSYKRRPGWSGPSDWQNDAWDCFDLVGEQRFLANTLANRMGQARLYVGQLAEDPSEDPEPVDDPALTGVLEAIGDSAAARGQLVTRMGVNLFVPGDCWLAGIPSALFPPGMLPPVSLYPEESPDLDEELLPTEGVIVDPNSIDIDDLQWRALSISELGRADGGRISIKLGEGDDEKIVCSPDDVILIRVWRSHPRKAWEADSPTRSSLPVLRELVSLTMHVGAQVDSRLAGAGMLLVPESAKRALMVAAGLPEDSDEDPFTDALIEAMMTPIADRANASAIVPLVITVPDESVAGFKHISFAQPLDAEARNLREEAIRRLALGEDCPPELLLGTSAMNHWGAWLVQEDTVTTHLEPPLALICDALTTQYLWPVLLDQGKTEDEVHQYVIWYDVSDLVVRPNRSQDAFALHEAGAISDAALRDATGFDQSDAPEQEENLPVEVTLAFDLVRAAPALINMTGGLPEIVRQIRAVLNNDIPDEAPAPAPVVIPPGLNGDQPEEPQGAPPIVPQTDANPPESPDAVPAAAAAVVDAFERDGADGSTYVHGYIDKTKNGARF